MSLQTQGEYGGHRQSFRAGVGIRPKDTKRSQIINLDIGIGDPVTPAPVKKRTGEMLGAGDLSWQVYPVETIVAEKLQTLVVRGGDNSRAKDIYDLYCHLPNCSDAVLGRAIEECFSFRQTKIPADIYDFLKKLDRTLLKKGWKSATSSLHSTPTFDEAFLAIIENAGRLKLSQATNKK